VIFIFVLVSIQLFSTSVFSADFELLGYQEFSSDHKVDQQKFGGLSDVVWDSSNEKLYVVTDDRGKHGAPRFYELSMNWDKKNFGVTNIKTITLSYSEKETAKEFGLDSSLKKIIDIEGIAILPWGNFLFSTEGDFNSRPRLEPLLFEAKLNGTIIRNYKIPEAFLFGKTGKPKTGVQDNRAFEGLTGAGSSYWIVNEEPLLQDRKRKLVRLQEYILPEAWVLKPGKEIEVPLSAMQKKDQEIINSITDSAGVAGNLGVSAMMPGDPEQSKKLLWIERAPIVSISGLEFLIVLYEVDLSQSSGPANKKLVSVLSNWSKDLKSKKLMDNIEGICWGPVYNGQKTIVLVSDNNFSNAQKTQIWWLAWPNEKNAKDSPLGSKGP
jgi:hypothetical protein